MEFTFSGAIPHTFFRFCNFGGCLFLGQGGGAYDKSQRKLLHSIPDQHFIKSEASNIVCRSWVLPERYNANRLRAALECKQRPNWHNRRASFFRLHGRTDGEFRDIESGAYHRPPNRYGNAYGNKSVNCDRRYRQQWHLHGQQLC